MNGGTGVSMNEYRPKKAAFDDAADYKEAVERRKRRIARRRRRERRRKLLLAGCLLVIALIAGLLAVFVASKRLPDAGGLTGTWKYEETATLQFDGEGRGTITLADTECTFSYTMNDQTLNIDFDNAYITDAAYTFSLEDDTLTLSGGTGTTGGIFNLKKTEK